MAEVVLRDVTKIYPGGVKAVDRLNLTIADREFIVLVGPSGCGKSTTLRMVAGLEDITGGTIRIGERVVNEIAPKDRDIAMVFQNYALYPHMTVYKNMAFGLMLRRKYGSWNNPLAAVLAHSKWKAAREEVREIDERVQQAARILGIEDLLSRRPRALSGGQRQRVAVGRAIVRDPKAFLFDEPLSNLDAKLRVEMRAEIKKLHRKLQTTTIYVTHDQEEAMTLGDRVVVMKDGLVQQCASAFEVYDQPANRFVAGFVGTPPMNFLEGRVVREGDGLFFDEGRNRLALTDRQRSCLGAHVDRPVVMGVRPEMLEFANGETGGASLRATVQVVEPLGDRMDVYASTERHGKLIARVDARTDVKEAEAATFRIDMERVHFFAPDEGGLNLTLRDMP